MVAISSGNIVAEIDTFAESAIVNSYPKAMANAVAVPATPALLPKLKVEATLVTAPPDPAPSQKTMSEVPFGMDTVAPDPCWIVALLPPVKEF